MNARPRLLFLITEDWYFWSHRLDLARAARDAGYAVTIATRVTDHGERIIREEFHLAPLHMSRRSRNPFGEPLAVTELISLYRRIRPDIVHHVAMKPILYGSLAAWFTGVPVVINAFAGLGYTFTEERSRVLRWMVKTALGMVLKLSQSIVLVQNRDDQERLAEEGIVPVSRTRVIAGSGVDVRVFSPGPASSGVPIVLLPARMLWDKGISEFVEAARALKRKGCPARFVLVGRRDEHNPAAIPAPKLSDWVTEGAVEWWGHRDDMPDVYRAAAVVVLPSYREGLPKVLLEAAACGKAIVTTDVPGCRDVVRSHDNGLLVPAKNSQALAEAIEQLLQDSDRRATMGARAREIAEKEWASPVITEQVLNLYRELSGGFGLPRVDEAM
jgi:glycosyltransferase involved in cell wall biosynthesis